MTSAAELLRITQPAVSRLVRDFESAVGLRLFQRRGTGVVPTQDATLLLAEVERSFVGLGRVAEAAQAIRSQEAGRVRIAAFPAFATSVLSRFLGRFVRERPNLRVSIQALPSHLVVEAVAAGQADFGYAVGPQDRPGFTVETLSASAVAIVPGGHRLASRPFVGPGDFAGERFVTLSHGTLFHARVATALEGVELTSLIETSWSESACLLVAEGAGVSLVDPFAASEFGERGLCVLRFEPAVDFSIVSLRLAQRPVTPLNAAIMRSLAGEILSFRTRD